VLLGVGEQTLGAISVFVLTLADVGKVFMTKRTSSQLTIEAVSPYFSQSIQTASKKLGVCCTLLKKICRKYGINRWPYRKIQSIERSIQQTKERLEFLEQVVIEEQNGNAYNEMLKLRNELVELERKKDSLLHPHKALVNPYNLEPNYMVSLDANSNTIKSPLWTYLPTQETAKPSAAAQDMDYSNVLPLSPVFSLDSLEPEYSLQSSSCDSYLPTASSSSCRLSKLDERFEDYERFKYPLEITSEVTAYSEAESPLKTQRLTTTKNTESQADSSSQLPWKMKWFKDNTITTTSNNNSSTSNSSNSGAGSGRIQGSWSRQEMSPLEKMSSVGMPRSFSHSSVTDEDHLLANRFQRQSSSSTERDRVWNRMEDFGYLTRTMDSENVTSSVKPLKNGMEDRTMYKSFSDDMILSNVTSVDDMSTIDENISYQYKTPSKLERLGANNLCQDSLSMRTTLVNAIRRVEQLEQENKQLRSKLRRLLGDLQETAREERCNFYTGLPSR